MNETLRPSRALGHPLWIAMLSLLALNDHVLKGAAPGWFTGKASDLAGLLVAPVLLAVLCRVSSRRGLLGCHLAVGLGFSAIQLWDPVADGLVTVLGLVGLPASVTADPTDLVALAGLGLSWRIFTPSMTRASTLSAPVRWVLGGTGLWFCVATHNHFGGSPRPWTDTGGGWQSFAALVYLHNDTTEDVRVLVRQLRPTVRLDCASVGDNPGAYLLDAHFAEGVSWDMPPETNIPVFDAIPTQAAESGAAAQVERGCAAALIEADGGGVGLVYWDGDPSEVHGIAGSGGAGDGVVSIARVASNVLDLTSSRSTLARPWHPLAIEDSCPAQPDRGRPVWTTVLFQGENVLTEVTAGVDGCYDLALTGTADWSWFLCVPNDLFPFEAGDVIDIAEEAHSLTLARPADGAMLAVGRDDSALEGLLLTPGTWSCGPSALSGCPVVAATADVQLFDDTTGDLLATLSAGEDNSSAITTPFAGEVRLLHYQHRLAVDTDCAGGLASAGTDLQWVVARWGTP